jgi:hypothetical protein
MVIPVAQLRPPQIRRRGTTSAAALLVLIAFAVALAVPASAGARARGVYAGAVSPLEPRFPYVAPTARSASRITISPWLTGATAAVVVIGAIALGLWTESHRADDGGLDEGGDWRRGDPEGPEGPPRPNAPGGEDLHWSLFEAEFRDYAATHERRRALAPAR